jgi:hypothetical protein
MNAMYQGNERLLPLFYLLRSRGCLVFGAEVREYYLLEFRNGNHRVMVVMLVRVDNPLLLTCRSIYQNRSMRIANPLLIALKHIH